MGFLLKCLRSNDPCNLEIESRWSSKSNSFLCPQPMMHPYQFGPAGCLSSNWVPMLEQRIDERILNTLFRISLKTILFRCVETAPFHCHANFDYHEQWVHFPLRPEKPTLSYKMCIFSYPKRWQCLAPKKVPFQIVFFFFFFFFFFKHRYQGGQQALSPSSSYHLGTSHLLLGAGAGYIFM